MLIRAEKAVIAAAHYGLGTGSCSHMRTQTHTPSPLITLFVKPQHQVGNTVLACVFVYLLLTLEGLNLTRPSMDAGAAERFPYLYPIQVYVCTCTPLIRIRLAALLAPKHQPL